MAQDFLKEVFKDKNEIDAFLSHLKNKDLKKSIYNSLCLLVNVDFSKYSVLIEDLIDELQVVIVFEDANLKDTITAVFREEENHKFYVGSCKFLSNEFNVKDNNSKIFTSILRGEYNIITSLKSDKVITREVTLLGVKKTIKIGLLHCLKKPDRIERKDGVKILRKEY